MVFPRIHTENNGVGIAIDLRQAQQRDTRLTHVSCESRSVQIILIRF